MRGFRRYGLSLVEVLTVVAILSILSALTLAVFANARRSALASKDIVSLHEIYAALALYESDANDVMPSTLNKALNYYASTDILMSDLDSRKEMPASGWTATPFVPCGHERLRYKISFAYLKTFSSSNNDGKNSEWSLLRSESQIGLLASPWDGVPVDGPLSEGRCGETVFQVSGIPLDGPIHRINMDGSYFKLRKRRSIYALGSLMDFFFNR
ncbi:MAG: prepilin-type N-terminal cleavage/methylation domain-containing protein [Armatimonadetes bacterium]|nr:prepilin-type N-terminal cleavage/methylation domain-containing protein [Armatimonadota bacterium]